MPDNSGVSNLEGRVMHKSRRSAIIALAVAVSALTLQIAPAIAAISLVSDITFTAGSLPIDVAISPDGATAYVSLNNSDAVTRIRMSDNTIIGPQLAVQHAPDSIVVSPDGTRVYVANEQDSVSSPGFSVSVIDAANWSVLATIPVGTYLSSLAVSPDGATLYVAATHGGVTQGEISIINTATNAVTSTVPVGHRPGGLSLTPNGELLIVPNEDDRTVSVVNTASRSVVATLNVGDHPTGSAIAPNGEKAYVMNKDDDTVSIIDVKSLTVASTSIATGVQPFQGQVSPDGTRLYVTSYDSSGLLNEIDLATNTTISQLDVGYEPNGLSVSPDNSRIYVANPLIETVAVVKNEYAPANITAPTLSGTPATGETLTTTKGTWSGAPSPSISYQWQSCPTSTCDTTTNIGIDQRTYVPNAADVGKFIRVKLTASNGTAPNAEHFTNVLGPVTDSTPVKPEQTLPKGAIPKKLNNPGKTIVNKAWAKTDQGQPVTAHVTASQTRGDVKCVTTVPGRHRKLTVELTGKCALTVNVTYTAPASTTLEALRTTVKYRVKRTS